MRTSKDLRAEIPQIGESEKLTHRGMKIAAMPGSDGEIMYDILCDLAGHCSSPILTAVAKRYERSNLSFYSAKDA